MPSRFRLADHLDQALRERGRHALEGLVEQQQLRAAHERAAERHQLLLAAGELRALARREAAQLRDQPVDLLQARARIGERSPPRPAPGCSPRTVRSGIRRRSSGM